jgi:hypothetical protein
MKSYWEEIGLDNAEDLVTEAVQSGRCLGYDGQALEYFVDAYLEGGPSIAEELTRNGGWEE